MKLPSEEQCMDWFKEFKVPRNIFQHCEKVRELAVFLAELLQEQGEEVNVELVGRAAWLHDIFKMVSLSNLQPTRFHRHIFSAEEAEMWKHLRQKYPGMYEGEVAYLFFQENYPEFALVLKHVSDSHYWGKSPEEELVHYADWRVFQQEIVSLQERINYLREAYPRADGVWEKRFQAILNFEKELEKRVGISAERFSDEIKNRVNHNNNYPRNDNINILNHK